MNEQDKDLIGRFITNEAMVNAIKRFLMRETVLGIPPAANVTNEILGQITRAKLAIGEHIRKSFEEMEQFRKTEPKGQNINPGK